MKTWLKKIFNQGVKRPVPHGFLPLYNASGAKPSSEYCVYRPCKPEIVKLLNVDYIVAVNSSSERKVTGPLTGKPPCVIIYHDGTDCLCTMKLDVHNTMREILRAIALARNSTGGKL